MEFRYFVQAPVIDDKDCARIIEALKEFHNHKHYILAANARVGTKGTPINHFNIPKLELLQSVAPQIKLNGIPLQWSADVTENMHIHLVKTPADQMNNQNYNSQICRILDREDKCRRFDLATSIQVAGINFGMKPIEDDEDDEEVQEDECITTMSALIANINLVTNITKGSQVAYNLFEEAVCL